MYSIQLQIVKNQTVNICKNHTGSLLKKKNIMSTINTTNIAIQLSDSKTIHQSIHRKVFKNHFIIIFIRIN
jgi:hypothetical protein